MGEFSSKLGIISCPGGEAFAHSVVNHLTRLFKRDLAQKTNYSRNCITAQSTYTRR